MVMKNCTVCGIEYNATGNAKTCSPECGRIRLRKRFKVIRKIWAAKNPHKDKQYSKKYRDANKEKIREANTIYRKANMEKERARQNRYRAKNKDRINARDRQKYDPVKAKARRDAYRAKNTPGYQISKFNSRAKRRMASGTITAQQWCCILQAHNHRCAYCGTDRDIVRDHVIPIVKGGTNTAGNIQPLCRSCNARKHDMTDAEYRAKYPHLITRNEPKSTLEAWQKAEKVKSA